MGKCRQRFADFFDIKKKKVLILFLFIYNLLKKKNLKRCRPCETQTIQTIR